MWTRTPKTARAEGQCPAPSPGPGRGSGSWKCPGHRPGNAGVPCAPRDSIVTRGDGARAGGRRAHPGGGGVPWWAWHCPPPSVTPQPG